MEYQLTFLDSMKSLEKYGIMEFLSDGEILLSNWKIEI